MKKLTILIAFFLLLVTVMDAQKLPQGMKYQAVARNKSGDVLAKEKIELKINLFSGNLKAPLIHYSETHSITTNELGLFTLAIGEGRSEKNAFEKIPWSSEEIWMEVEIRDKIQSHFVTISSSKLLAVPYAFHSGTANSLSNNKDGQFFKAPAGSPSAVWHLVGNRGTDPETDKLGTTDYVDLIMVTNNLPRLRITKDGDINIENSLNVGLNLHVGNDAAIDHDATIGNDLTVKNNVFLNTLGGSTTNNGPFSVTNLSPTYLTGILTADKDTWLKSKLTVDGVSDLNSALNVNNMSASSLTGTLTVDQDAWLKSKLLVDGGTHLNGRLFVNNSMATTLTGTLSVHEDAIFKQKVFIDNPSLNSANPSTGGLVVAGGAGIGENLHVGRNMIALGDGLIVGKAGIGDRYPNVKFNVSAPASDDLLVNFEVTGTENKFHINRDGQVYLRSTKAGVSGSTGNYGMFIDGQDQGILIRLKGKDFPDQNNHYMSFSGADNVLRGRIEGQTSDDYFNDPIIIAYLALQAAKVAAEIAAIAEAVITLDPDAGQIAAITADLVWFGIDLGDKATNVGVAYESGSGDYAEWLEKADLSEDFKFGEIVAVKGGKIARDFDDPDHLLVISLSPIVLGKMPLKGKQANFEKVAFLGQVPVRVTGPVQVGDYIIRSGKKDGTGIAVSKKEMRITDFPNVVGVAWSQSSVGGTSLVNVALGLNRNDMVGILEKQENEISEMKKDIKAIKQLMTAKVSPEEKSALSKNESEADQKKLLDQGVSMELQAKPSVRAQRPTVTQNKVPAFTDAQILQAYQQVQKALRDKGIPVDTIPALKALFSNQQMQIQQFNSFLKGTN